MDFSVIANNFRFLIVQGQGCSGLLGIHNAPCNHPKAKNQSNK